MKTSDAQLHRMFVRATDEVVPSAPWLEAQIVDSLRHHGTARRLKKDPGGLEWIRPSLRPVAVLVAVLIAIGAVAALLTSARLLHSVVPATMPATQSPSPSRPPQADVTVPFAPSPAVRDPRWPAGGPVSTRLAGSWRQTPSAPILYLGGYTFQLGEETPDPTSYPGNINPDLFGNVVVNGSEMDFIAETCAYVYAYTVERYTYTLSGDTLVIAKGPHDTQCSWPRLEGTYTRVLTS